MKILATADLHLGRRPSRIPADLDLVDVTRASDAAWRDAVDLALREEVDAVLVAGDLVEHDDDLFEAFPSLLEAGRRLADAGIEWVLVSGNHDARALPALLRELPQARHLGADARWETVTLHGRDGTEVDVVGWSFPADGSPVTTSPIDGLPRHLSRTGPPPARPILGLLHGDLDAHRSPYAPVSRSSLADTHASAWLLGHVHVPTFGPPGSRSTHEPQTGWYRAGDGGPPPIGYLGSLVGTDPGEGGGRGPWLIELDGEGTIRYRHLHRAPLAWTECTIDAASIDGPDDVSSSILRGVRALYPDAPTWDRAPGAVGVRLTISGRHDQADALRREIDQWARRDADLIVPSSGRTRYFVHAVHHDLRSAVDLAGLAAGDDPVGLLARRLIALEDPRDPLRQSTLDEARAELLDVWTDRAFDLATPHDVDDERLATELRRAGWAALDALLATRESSP